MTSVFKISTFRAIWPESAKMHVRGTYSEGDDWFAACGARALGDGFNFFLVTIRGVRNRADVCIRCRRFVERSL